MAGEFRPKRWSSQREAEMESTYETCEWCAKAIAYGNAALTINRHIEQMDRTEKHPDGVVTVVQADVLLTLCAECGNALDVDALKQILAAPIRRPS